MPVFLLPYPSHVGVLLNHYSRSESSPQMYCNDDWLCGHANHLNDLARSAHPRVERPITSILSADLRGFSGEKHALINPTCKGSALMGLPRLCTSPASLCPRLAVLGGCNAAFHTFADVIAK